MKRSDKISKFADLSDENGELKEIPSRISFEEFLEEYALKKEQITGKNEKSEAELKQLYDDAVSYADSEFTNNPSLGSVEYRIRETAANDCIRKQLANVFNEAPLENAIGKAAHEYCNYVSKQLDKSNGQPHFDQTSHAFTREVEDFRTWIETICKSGFVRKPYKYPHAGDPLLLSKTIDDPENELDTL